MHKFLAVILALSAASCRFLHLPTPDPLPEKQRRSQPRELLEPVTCTLTVVAIGFLLGFVAGRMRWRRNPDYQETVLKLKTAPQAGFQKSLFKFYGGVFTKELVNRCLSTVKSVTAEEDLPLTDYFVELCLAWGRFTRNHLHMSIKFFDVAYSLQYFDLFLTRELVVKTSEKEPETVRPRNKRFVALLQSEIEGQRAGRDSRFSQTASLRLLNSFYGGFWEVVFQEMLDAKLTPKKMDLDWPADRARKSTTSCFWFA